MYYNYTPLASVQLIIVLYVKLQTLYLSLPHINLASIFRHIFICLSFQAVKNNSAQRFGSTVLFIPMLLRSLSSLLFCSEDRIRTCTITYELYLWVFQGYSALSLLLTFIHTSTISPLH